MELTAVRTGSGVFRVHRAGCYEIAGDAAQGRGLGGLGLAPGANIGDGYGVFEATHGTAPKYADTDMINPAALIRSAVLMFEFMGWPEAGELIERALAATIAQRRVTYDLERLMEMEGVTGIQKLGTSEFAGAIIENMAAVKAGAV